MIIPQRNWDYREYFQVKFGEFVQTSQVNYPRNKNPPKPLDGIHLGPAPNLQGRHQIMDLRIRELITTPKVFKIPIADVVINIVDKMAE